MQARIDAVADKVSHWLKQYEELDQPSLNTMASIVKSAAEIWFTGPEVASLQRKYEECLEWDINGMALSKFNQKLALEDLDAFINKGVSMGFYSVQTEKLLHRSQAASLYNDNVLKSISSCNLNAKQLRLLLSQVSSYEIILPCLDKITFALSKSKFMESYNNVDDYSNYHWSKVEEIYQSALDYNLEVLASRLSVCILRGQSLTRRIETYVSSEQVVDFEVLDTFLEEKVGVPLPNNAHALLDWLIGARNWCERAHQIMNPTTHDDRRNQAENVEILSKEHANFYSKLHLREADILFEEMRKTERWNQSLSLLLVGQKTVSFLECIKYLKETLSFASTSSGDKACICRSNLGYVMIQCIDCQFYYHRHCLQIPKGFDPNHFQCPVCDISLGYNPFQKPSFQSFSALVSESNRLTIFPRYGEEFQNLLVMLDKFLSDVDDAIDTCSNIWDARDLLRRLYGLFVVTNQTVRLEVSLYIRKCQSCDGKDDPASMLKCVKCNRYVHMHCVDNSTASLAPFHCSRCDKKRVIGGPPLNIVLKRRHVL